MAAITILALFVAVGLILFSVNPTQKSTQAQLKQSVMSQHAIICAQVQNTANAYRFRSLAPNGEVEPIRHFLTRMQAQQQTLRLARGSECRSAPGFPPVGLQVRRALGQIHRILQSFEPRLRKPVAQDANGHRHASFSPSYSAPSHAGIGEEGVPATLKPELAPSAPLEPQKGHQEQPAEPEAPATAPEAIPAPSEPLPSNEPEVAQEESEGGTRVVEKERRELPVAPLPLPINVEVELPKLEGLP
jgi:hypothetical protein